jgi:hypothetical protein
LNDNIENGNMSLNTGYMLRRLRGSGYTNRQSGVRWVLERLCGGLFRHILLAKRRIPFRVRQHWGRNGLKK